jgi:hypothetical protein
MRFPLRPCILLLSVLAHSAFAEWRVATDFEGGNAEVVHLDVFIDLHNPGASDPAFFFGPFDFTAMGGIKRRNYERWVELAAGQVTTPEPVAPAYRFATYVKTDEERSRMSGEWVRTHTAPHTIATTLETGWNSPLKSAEGYGEIGAGPGRALAAYLADDPRRAAE